MFNIAPSEILVIFAIALIFLGPEQLPEVAKTVAKFIRELKRTTNSISDAIHRETEDVKKDVQSSLIPEELSISRQEKPKNDSDNKQG